MQQKTLKSTVQLSLLAVCMSGIAMADDDNQKATAYPTAVIADYVLGCMAANGNRPETLHQCSCSFDYIAERLDYADYEKMQTVMSVRLDRGQRGIFFRDSSWAKNMIERLENLQAESTLRCF